MNNDDSNDADQMIARAARDYNEPGAVPREEMWSRIVERRRAAAVTAPRLAPFRRNRLWIWPGVGVAAAGLIAIGVSIGRGVERSRVRDQRVDASPAHASRDSNSTAAAPAPGPSALMEQPPALEASATRATDADDNRAGAIAYRLAVVQHVAGSEAMIMAFRASAKRGDVDAQLAQWSRDLLGETRMLEASAPKDDVRMRRLLEDLELVTAQIVQYTNHNTHSADDLDLIEQSIRRRGVIANIRTLQSRDPALTSSAGRSPSGT